ncbi:hypothetical protein GCM10009534_15280 [Kribbella sandramycini]
MVEGLGHRVGEQFAGSRVEVEGVVVGEVAEGAAGGEQDDVLARAAGRAGAERDDRPVAFGPAVEPDIRVEGVGEVEGFVVPVEDRADDGELGARGQRPSAPFGRTAGLAQDDERGRPEPE